MDMTEPPQGPKEESEKQGRVERLVRFLRHLDRWFNATFWDDITKEDFKATRGGQLLKRVLRKDEYVSNFLKLFLPRGHSALGLWLGAFLVFLVVFGPTTDFRGAGWRTFAIGLAIGLFLMSFTLRMFFDDKSFLPEKALVWNQFGLLTFVCIFVWFSASPFALEVDETVYRHMLIPLIGLVLGVLLICKFLAWLLFRKFDYQEELKQVELFVDVEKIDDSVWDHICGALLVPLGRPLQLLLPAAIWIVSQPQEDWKIGLWVLGGTLVLLGAAEVAPRLRAMVDTLGRGFFQGVPQLLSLAVIVLAALKVADVGYVSTLMGVAPEPNSYAARGFALLLPSVNWTIIYYILALYGITWFYDYWSSRFLSEKLVQMFGSKNPQGPESRVDYLPNKGVKAKGRPVRVKRDRRVLQVHGSNRFAVVGELDNGDKPSRAGFHFYDAMGLIDNVLNPAWEPASPKAHRAHRLKNLVRFYRLLPLVLLGGSIWWVTAQEDPQAAELVLENPTSVNLTPEQLVFGSKDSCDKDRDLNTPRILIAGSGGGTRAALNTAAVLRGLVEGNQGCNIMLLSGVSGSSAAMAYFAGHNDLRKQYNEEDFNTFANVMGASFIQDALEGLGEWRIYANAKTSAKDFGFKGEGGDQPVKLGFRTGHLLSESFERRFGLGNRDRIGSVGNLGVIFNTAMTGAFPWGDWRANDNTSQLPWSELRQACDETDSSLPEREATCGEALQSGEPIGGRLLLTNLKADVFPVSALNAAPDEYLFQAVLSADQIPLTRAAALSANFPPVFSNAAIDVHEPSKPKGVRYWVTDGGATDNRGLISLLYALRSAITDHAGGKPLAEIEWPPIHIVVAEASGGGLTYSQDRGIGAGLSSKEKLASELINELLCSLSLEQRKGVSGGVSCGVDHTLPIQLHYLSMPTVYRSGGLDTHWMMPTSVTFEKPFSVADRNDAESGEPNEMRLEGCTTRFSIENLYSAGRNKDAAKKRDCRASPSSDSAPDHVKVDDESLRILRRWIRDDAYRPICPQWATLAGSLGFEVQGICDGSQ
ncbi:MAG: patatin-like phospholipase family protein, partial [Pseudomonadota bacterium]